MAKKITIELTREELTTIQSSLYYYLDVINETDIQRNFYVINHFKEIINKIKEFIK